MPQSDSGSSDQRPDPDDPRPRLTPVKIEIIEDLESAFKEIDSPICCFGPVPFDAGDPKIFYSVPATKAESASPEKPQVEG